MRGACDHRQRTRLMEPVPEVPIEQVTVFATGLDHPEGLAFDREGHLWAGSESGQIYRIDPSGKVEVITIVEGFCCGLAFSPADELFLCHPRMGIVKIERDGKFSVFADQAAGQRIAYANFGVFDRAGNYWVTDSGNWKKQNGYLLRFTPDGQGKVAAGPFGYANGLALSADEKTLFMVESDRDRIFRFDVSADGSVGEAKVYAENVGRLPDGLALDAEGNLYATCYASDEIHRFSPNSERAVVIYDRHALTVGGPTNVAFGGKDFDEIFVANLCRYTITRFRAGRKGQPLANAR
ncbi:MAG: SMP-30/gluconolactonase/LRE family protein [Terracidiphilus sp.]